VTDLWLGMLIAAGAVGIVGVMALVGLRGGAARARQRRHFVCPALGFEVECELVQDVRTGQWISVERCSAFPDPTWVHCDQDCARLLNLGIWADSAVSAAGPRAPSAQRS
jgi:hypothetical protein